MKLAVFYALYCVQSKLLLLGKYTRTMTLGNRIQASTYLLSKNGNVTKNPHLSCVLVYINVSCLVEQLFRELQGDNKLMHVHSECFIKFSSAVL